VAIPSISYRILKMVKLGIKRLKAANISGGTFTFNIVNQE
jgi:hypothetical protein